MAGHALPGVPGGGLMVRGMIVVSKTLRLAETIVKRMGDGRHLLYGALAQRL